MLKPWHDPDQSILVVGSSPTYGDGHGPNYLHPLLNPYKRPPADTVWCYQVGESVNNISQGGIGNQDTTDLIVSHITDSVKEVWCQYTWYSRKRVWIDDDHYAKVGCKAWQEEHGGTPHTHPVANDQLQCKLSLAKLNSYKFHSIMDKWYVTQQNDYAGLHTDMREILFVQEFLRARNVKFYWMLSYNFDPNNVKQYCRLPYHEHALQAIVEKIEWSNCFTIQGLSWDIWMRENLEQTPDGHFGPEAHKIWANEFKKWRDAKG